MSSEVECRKCEGTGEFHDGSACFSCKGSGVVKDIRYQTVNASESNHPALRAEREFESAPFVPPDPAHVKRELSKCKAMLTPGEDPESPEIEAQAPRQWDCEHVWGRDEVMCTRCGIFHRQWMDSLYAVS